MNMMENEIRELLERVKNGETGTDEACELLKELPYKDLGFANVDNHRAIRTGFPEVIYSRGKKPEQIRDIMAELVEKGGNIMATKATERDYEAVRERLPQAEFFEDAGIIAVTDDAHASAMNRSVALSLIHI